MLTIADQTVEQNWLTFFGETYGYPGGKRDENVRHYFSSKFKFFDRFFFNSFGNAEHIRSYKSFKIIKLYRFSHVYPSSSSPVSHSSPMSF